MCSPFMFVRRLIDYYGGQSSIAFSKSQYFNKFFVIYMPLKTYKTKSPIGHEIASMHSMTSAFVCTLHTHWINTIEQLVALASTEEGRKGLSVILEVGETQIDEILQESMKILGSTLYEKLINAQHIKTGGALGARFKGIASQDKSNKPKGNDV